MVGGIEMILVGSFVEIETAGAFYRINCGRHWTVSDVILLLNFIVMFE